MNPRNRFYPNKESQKIKSRRSGSTNVTYKENGVLSNSPQIMEEQISFQQNNNQLRQKQQLVQGPQQIIQKQSGNYVNGQILRGNNHQQRPQQQFQQQQGQSPYNCNTVVSQIQGGYIQNQMGNYLNTTTTNNNIQIQNKGLQRGQSNASSKKHTPEKRVALKQNNNELNFATKVSNQQNANNFLNNTQEQDYYIQINDPAAKRQQKFNLIRNVYEKRHTSLNRSFGINSSNNTPANMQHNRHNLIYNQMSNTPSSMKQSYRMSSKLQNNNSKDFKKLSINNTSMNLEQQYRMESAMSNLDEGNSFYDKGPLPFDLNKILPNQLGGSKNDSFSALDFNYQQKLSPQKINKVNSHNVGSMKNTKGSQALELLEWGKKLFKDNDLKQAIEKFKESIILDNKLIEANYLMGVCYLGQFDYEKSVKEFNYVIEKNPTFRKNIYLLSSIAYKKLNNITYSIKMLNKAIQKYPKYYDAYIYRGKLFLKEKKYDKALQDFSQAINLNSQKGLGFLGKADCLRYLNQFEQAAELYTKAIEAEEFVKGAALLKRGISYIDCKNYEKAQQDLNEVLLSDPTNSEAYYYKGIVQLKNSESSSEALLSFEQSIKHNNSKKSVTKSLFEIARIHIEQRDFYAALHTLSRAEYLDIDKKFLEKFRLYVEGVINLMKRKFKDALENFTQIQKNHDFNDFLKPLFHTYRAYGYFCLGKHKSALSDYNLVEQSQTLDSNSSYNKLLCQGILSIQENNFDISTGFLDQASKLYPSKLEPYFYKGVGLIKQALETEDDDLKSDILLQGLKEIDKGAELNEAISNIFYYRAIVRCYLGYFSEGIADIDKAIEKSEDNVPKYFYLRGHAFGCCKQYKQAVNDLSICIQLDENFEQAYLERAKNFHYSRDSNSAFADLQKYISLKPNDPEIHKWAGNLLFNSCAFDDAIKAYSHSDVIEQDAELLSFRAKCQIIQRDLKSGYQDIKRIVELTSSKSFTYDKTILNALLETSKGYFQTVNTDKILAMTENKEIQGRIFKIHDTCFYLAIFYFYQNKFDLTIKYLLKAQKLKDQFQIDTQLEKKNLIQSTEDEFLQDLNDDEEEKSPFPEFESFNSTDMLTNLAYAHIMKKEFKIAIEYIQKIQDYLDENQLQNYNLLLSILKQEIDQNKQNSNQESEKEDQRETEIQMISTTDRLCDQFPTIISPFQAIKNIKIRPTFDIPCIQAPSLQPVFDNDLLEKFEITDVENRPEAPWIRRNLEGIIFTDNIQIFDSIDILDTEERKKNIQKNQKNQEIDQLDEDMIAESGRDFESDDFENNGNRRDIQKIKMNLALDKDTEEKLAKIMKKKQGQN